MNKNLYVFKNNKRYDVLIRNYHEQDFEDLIDLQRKAFPPPFPPDLLWNHEQLTSHITRFPEGALCIQVDGRTAGSITALRTNHPNESHTWEQITSDGYIKNHEDDGEVLYIVDICIDPDYRGLGLGKELMRAMYETVVYLGVKKLAGGSRMPGYKKVQDQMTVEKYYEKVVKGELNDPVVTFLMKSGRMPERLMKNYLEDEDSADCAVLMTWKNPFMT
ncbi:GNAT family N-acetyltransferase [Jeotgalibacillus haloalkalitolerans]|uniref:GNAT family N-acetyltransferase n=1 Tax=Jeotgalibacillus haloalkalitolerans TaxID=3104292 RepID=A0ABU5KP37_9BACL|nr:GNAT family N-acetyltransferase [Jeotgalibacillus sp. HH7-29]MDZ5712930.1 GNAT family N-acetyltransferase [Jeotgalibacillus sp. HH7-29]